MNRRRTPWEAMQDSEVQQTIGFFFGLLLLGYWGFLGFNPDSLVAGLVASLLVIQRVLPFGKKVNSNDDVTQQVPSDGRDSGVSVGGGAGESDGSVGRRNLRRRHLLQQPA
jgi:hypothetical protein